MAHSDTFNCAVSDDFGLYRLGNVVVNPADLTDADKAELNKKLNSITPMITVHLAYAESAKQQHYLTLQVQEGTSLHEALAQAGWLSRFEDLAVWCKQVADITVPKAKLWHVGIYSQKQPLNYQLQAQDRIEVYRSLSADPMSQRKNKSKSRPPNR
ncbi:RnfH family protein [Psychrobacter sp. AH5]|uniref:RnfH family protein n=1 Tax=Psychrobacter sp. AH5 TaxID=2937433 RepID=UPI0033413D95